MKEFLVTLILKITHRLWNRQISRILCHAYSERVINSEQLHVLASLFAPTQKHAVYGNQKYRSLVNEDKRRKAASMMREHDLQHFERDFYSGLGMIKHATVFLLAIACLPLLCGCDEAKAATVPTTSQVALWSAADAQQALEDLRAIRSQEKLLQEIKNQTAATNAAIATLTDRQTEFMSQLTQSSKSTNNAVDKVSSSLSDLRTDIDGVEQRLDNPVFPPAPPLSSSTAPPCISIAGIDYDLNQLIADWYTIPWTWDGSQDENGLKAHLASHAVTGIDGLSFAQLKKVHAAVHEKERSALATSVAPGATGSLQLFGDVVPDNNPLNELAVNPTPPNPGPRNDCPNGYCPQVVRSKTVQVTRHQTAPSSSVSVSSGSVSYQPYHHVFTRSVSSCSNGRCRLRRR